MSEHPIDNFTALLEQALAQGSLRRLVLGKPRAAAGDLVRVSVRPVLLKNQVRLAFVHTHATRDITKNLSAADGLAAVRTLLTETLQHAHLFTLDEDVQ